MTVSPDMVKSEEADEKLRKLISRVIYQELQAMIDREITKVLKDKLKPIIEKRVRRLLAPGRN